MSVRHGFTVLLKAGSKDAESDDSDPYIEELKKLNLDPVAVPVLDFHYINKEELSACLRRTDEFSGIVLSSPRAVEAVARAFHLFPQGEKENLLSAWKSKVNFVVGEATAKAANSHLSLHCLGREAGSADALVLLILHEIPPSSKPLLFPCSNIRKDTIISLLQAQGVGVHEIISYETVVHPALQATLKNSIESKGIPEIIIFFSPSGVQCMMQIFQLLQFPVDLIKYAAIGATTRRALEEVNLVPWCTSQMPTAKALAAAIQEALTNTHS